MEALANSLVELLPRKDRRLLLALCEPTALQLCDVLCNPRKPMRYIYLPIDSRISLVAQLPGQTSLEVGMVGHEGMLGAHLILGVSKPPWQAVVQGPGAALRAGVVDFRRLLSQSTSLHRGLARYLCVLLSQLSVAPACQRFHTIGPRLARWLLMSQDRARVDRFHATHETLAAMLGVRREGVTMAAGALQRQRLIAYHRGEVTVLNRVGLRTVACSCYESDRAAYAAVMN